MSFQMWTEKYRPVTLEDMINQKDIVARLKSFVESKNVPHCIFAGPPGTGKTTAALCLARDLYGPRYREYLMELNASDERGINVVRQARFILIANYSGKIIEPIQSRCAPFRFTYLTREDVIQRIHTISDKEDIKISEEGIEAILEISGGDLRRTTNILQTAASVGKKIDAETVYSVVGRANPYEQQQA